MAATLINRQLILKEEYDENFQAEHGWCPFSMTLLASQDACGEEDKSTAESYNMAIWEAQSRPAFDPHVWLNFAPKHLAVDIIPGHDMKPGKTVQIVTESHNCKWVQEVHTDPDELAMYKNYPRAITKREGK